MYHSKMHAAISRFCPGKQNSKNQAQLRLFPVLQYVISARKARGDEFPPFPAVNFFHLFTMCKQIHTGGTKLQEYPTGAQTESEEKPLLGASSPVTEMYV